MSRIFCMYTICPKKQTKSLKFIKWYLGCTLTTNLWISIRSNDQVSKLIYNNKYVLNSFVLVLGTSLFLIDYNLKI